MNKDLIKYALIAVGVYLVWKYVEEQGGVSHWLDSLGGAKATVPPTGYRPPVTGAATTVGTGPSSPSGTTPSTTPTVQPVVTLRDRVRNAVLASGQGESLTIDQFCWFYATVSGKACPDPDVAWPAIDRSQAMSFDQFWNLMQSAGLGVIAPAYQQTIPSWLM